jgi:hypothetical protein
MITIWLGIDTSINSGGVKLVLSTQTSHYNYIYIIHVKTDTQKAINIANIVITPYKLMVIRKGVLSAMRTKYIYALLMQLIFGKSIIKLF